MDAKSLEGMDLAALFAAGAASALKGRELPGPEAEAFVRGVCKQAAMGKVASYDDEEDTFWGRNKNWLIPTIVGALAFKLGGDAGRFGRQDKSYLENLMTNLWGGFKSLLGYPGTPASESIHTRRDFNFSPPKVPPALIREEIVGLASPKGSGDVVMEALSNATPVRGVYGNKGLH